MINYIRCGGILKTHQCSVTCVFRTLRNHLIFQVSLHVNGYFGTITKCPDYGGVPIFKCPDFPGQCLHVHRHFGTKCPDYGGVSIFKCPD